MGIETIEANVVRDKHKRFVLTDKQQIAQVEIYIILI